MDADHGTRASYVRGCKCLPCRAANASYEAGREARAAESVLVDAAEARKHLQWLKEKAVGCHQASALSGLSWVLLYGIRSGRRKTVRASTAAKVLAIPAQPGDKARINSYATRHLIRCLLGEGFTTEDLADRLKVRVGWLERDGLKARKGRSRIKKRTADRVRRLHHIITLE